jgi:NDP-sugar pyrophosphorylase family protein
VSIERETFPRMLERPGRLYAMRSGCYWLDIGTPGKYFDAQLDVLVGKVGLPPTATAVADVPGVWTEAGAVVDPTAVLEAPVLIGSGATVAAGARVARSVVGPGCRVGAGAVVRDSVVLEGVDVDDGSEVVRVVLGPDHARLEIEGTA